jgi:hypothetical protein
MTMRPNPIGIIKKACRHCLHFTDIVVPRDIVPLLAADDDLLVAVIREANPAMGRLLDIGANHLMSELVFHDEDDTDDTDDTIEGRPWSPAERYETARDHATWSVEIARGVREMDPTTEALARRVVGDD